MLQNLRHPLYLRYIIGRSHLKLTLISFRWSWYVWPFWWGFTRASDVWKGALGMTYCLEICCAWGELEGGGEMLGGSLSCSSEKLSEGAVKNLEDWSPDSQIERMRKRNEKCCKRSRHWQSRCEIGLEEYKLAFSNKGGPIWKRMYLGSVQDEG